LGTGFKAPNRDEHDCSAGTFGAEFRGTWLVYTDVCG
jgi:hypothetical protein